MLHNPQNYDIVIGADGIVTSNLTEKAQRKRVAVIFGAILLFGLFTSVWGKK